MKKYLITYEVENKSKDYASLFKEIKELGRWWRYLDTVWIVKTEELSADAISKRLEPHLDRKPNGPDYLLVVKIDDSNEASGWLPKAAWEWLKSDS